MTLSNGNIFCVTGPLLGESTGDRWIPLTKTSDVELWCDLSMNKWLSKQSRRRWFGMLSRPLWRHCNVTEQAVCSEISVSEGRISYILGARWPKWPPLWISTRGARYLGRMDRLFPPIYVTYMINTEKTNKNSGLVITSTWNPSFGISSSATSVCERATLMIDVHVRAIWRDI